MKNNQFLPLGIFACQSNSFLDHFVPNKFNLIDWCKNSNKNGRIGLNNQFITPIFRIRLSCIYYCWTSTTHKNKNYLRTDKDIVWLQSKSIISWIKMIHSWAMPSQFINLNDLLSIILFKIQWKLLIEKWTVHSWINSTYIFSYLLLQLTFSNWSSMHLTITRANSLFSSATSVKTSINGLLLQFKVFNVSRYSFCTSSSFSVSAIMYLWGKNIYLMKIHQTNVEALHLFTGSNHANILPWTSLNNYFANTWPETDKTSI